MLGHYDRTKDGLGENVVPERTQLNYNLAVDDQPLKQLDFVHKRLGEVRCLKRKDVNVLCDWVVTMPKDLADEYREPFFKAAYNFFAEKYGHGDTPTRVLANGRGFLRHGRTPQRTITSPLHPVTGLPLSRLLGGFLF